MTGELVRAGALLGIVALLAGTAWGVVRASLGHGSWSVLALPGLACVAVILWIRRASRD